MNNTQPLSPSDEREAFEAAWIARQRAAGIGSMLEDSEFCKRNADGSYLSLSLDPAWWAWQTGRALLASAKQTPGGGEAVAEFIKAAEDVLEKTPCDCSDRRRYEHGAHLSGCHLFDLNAAHRRMRSAPTAPAPSLPSDKATTPDMAAIDLGATDLLNELAAAKATIVSQALQLAQATPKAEVLAQAVEALQDAIRVDRVHGFNSSKQINALAALRALQAAPTLPTEQAPEGVAQAEVLGFMDAGDAAREGEHWLEPIARTVDPLRGHIERFRAEECKPGSDNHWTVLWDSRRPVAAYMVMRDGNNWAKLVRWVAPGTGAQPVAVPDGWRPFGTEPRDGTRFLATCATGQIRLVHWDDPGGDKYPIDDPADTIWDDTPTHWMPLPAAPNSQAKE